MLDKSIGGRSTTGRKLLIADRIVKRDLKGKPLRYLKDNQENKINIFCY